MTSDSIAQTMFVLVIDDWGSHGRSVTFDASNAWSPITEKQLKGDRGRSLRSQSASLKL